MTQPTRLPGSGFEGQSRPGASAPGAVASASLVALRALDKRFANGTLALSQLNLEVAAGEFLSLLGPSGCGKSTALRLIAGLTAPSAGEIVWGPAANAARPEIGFVFQEPTLAPWSTVFANVWLPLRLRGVSRRQAADRVEQALSLVGLEAFSGALPRELSGGMKMRVSIARALVLRPPLLLLDEPFAALDEITRFRLNDDLLRLRDSLGATVVFVTHSVYESVYLSSRIAVFGARPGRVAAWIEVDAPSPRPENFRASKFFLDRCQDASQALERAARPEPDQ